MTRPVAVVTGGSGALGAAVGVALAGDGYAVTGWDVGPPLGGVPIPNVDHVDCDVTDRASVRAAMEATIRRSGEAAVLVNAVGVGQLRDLFVDVPGGDWDRVVAVNLLGPMNAIRAVIPSMRELGKGVIVNICSIWSTNATARFRSAYIASKWGLLGATKAIATELIGEGIRVCAVSPGPVDTPMTAALADDDVRSAWMKPGDVAAAVRFAVSDAGAGLVGGEIQLFGRARPDPGV